MRTIYSTIASLALIVTSVFSASAQDHLAFKGIPIDGKSSDFVAKLVGKGFVVARKTDDGTWMTGTFTGKDCTLLVESSIISHTSNRVYVLFGNETDWATIKNSYATIKRGLTLKYGEPSVVNEEFRSPYKEGEGYAYMAFKDGDADWQSLYKTDLGIISLYIRAQDWNNLSLIIRYEDSANCAKAVSELTEDL